MTDSEYVRGLIQIGHRDYIASRVLLNNGNILEGAMLASMAVEKYLKAYLGFSGIRCSYHMDNIGQIKRLYQQHSPYKNMFEILDSNFIEVLSKAYRYRYLDEKTITKPDTIGFLVNQFLGTLDFTILKLDGLIKLNKVENGVESNHDTPLKREWKKRNKDLMLNNYVAEGVTKVEFMNRKSEAFGFYVTPHDFGMQIEINGKDVVGVYEDKIWLIKTDFSPQDDSKKGLEQTNPIETN